MLTRPVALGDAALMGVLGEHWGLDATVIEYLPVGFGSHHWKVEDRDRRTWFVTVDDLDARRDDEGESRSSVFARLDAALTTAYVLHRQGGDYVVAPVAESHGKVLMRIGGRWADAVYPMVAGESFVWGPPLSVEHRRAVVELIAKLHTAPPSARVHAGTDDYRLPNRADLERAIEDHEGRHDAGPFSERLADLLATNKSLVLALLRDYDDLVAAARADTGRNVLTHGEPHPGNTLRTAAGWLLVDWDTALIGSPERDLWLLEPGDGSAVTSYTALTGIPIVSERLDLFRLAWDLKDLGSYVARFRSTHGTTADDAKSWEGITAILSRRSDGIARESPGQLP